MINYLKGILTVKTPAYVVLELSNGIGYHLHISLHTHSKLPAVGQSCQIFTHLHIKEDAHNLYGFAEASEKELFLHLISISGIGPSTAQIMLSSMNPTEIQQAIVDENLTLLKAIKGIGAKTAQLIILQLKDKLSKLPSTTLSSYEGSGSTAAITQEALDALAALGIAKPVAQKAIEKVLKTNKDIQTVEALIKKTLQSL